ncbi:glycosyltransferase [Kineococcus sp. SYSU DK006]|uniref:glycosyltransferase n=1 Tax=Kineococcus sp. SYSU DK006 TaxID=3383127 RepID=UPI003D7DDB9F
MRVLQVIASLEPGGAERMVVQLAADAREHGHEVAVASAGGAWVPRLGCVPHHAVPLIARSRTGLLRTAAALHALVRELRPDVVHSHNVGVTVAAQLALAAARSPAPLVTTVHGLAHEDYPSAARLLRLTRALVVSCAPAVDRALGAAGLPPARRTVVVNGAALQEASAQRVAAVREVHCLRGRVVVGLGRLVEQKAWGTLVEAARSLDEDVDVVVAGQGPLLEPLRRQADAAGGRVRFIGAVDDVAALLATASCLVSTSSWEGLPLSLLEALSLGVPAVATSVDGVVDVVLEDTALLVPPGEPAAVAGALRRVLDEPGTAQALSSAALRARDGWAPQRMLDAYRDLYARVLREPRRR